MDTAAPPRSALFRRGAIAMVPLWAGVAPFGLAFGILARAAGYSILQTQAFSIFVFAGASEVAAVTLTMAGATGIAIVLTALLLNLRHVLYGLSLSGLLRMQSLAARFLVPFVMTDESYGLTVKEYLDGQGGPAFLAGAGLSLYAAFNLATLAGAILGTALPDLQSLGLDLIFPLTFLALLVPLLRTWTQVAVAAVSGGLALGLSHLIPAGTTILISAVAASALGTVLHREEG
jgi:4-azaleucine resistance transporter AzlC